MRRMLMMTVALFLAASARADDWPQWLGPQRDGVWREDGIFDSFPKDGPRVRWRTPIGAGYAGPAVADGKVYVTDRVLPKGGKDPKNPFGRKEKVPGKERILCLDEKSGETVWKHEYDCPYQVSYAAGPRCTPIVAGNRVYSLGTMGDLYCLDARKGEVIWSKNLAREYGVDVPLWGYSAHPLLDGDRLICMPGGKGTTVVALNKDNGKEIWRALSASEPGYAPPMIYEIKGKRRLIVWTPAAINALEPETGKVVWSHPFTGRRRKEIEVGLCVSSPRVEKDRLFVTAFYEGPLMLKLNGDEKPEIAWRGKGTGEQPRQTDGLHSIMPTPFWKDGHIYGVCSYGELRCLTADTGKRVWSTHAATTGDSVRWGNAFLVAHGDRFFLFNEKGDLIIARLTPKGYDEISRVNILAPTNTMAGRPVVWSHPAFANRSIYARNDREIVCISLSKAEPR